MQAALNRALFLVGGQLTGARYLGVCKLALELLTATRIRQQELHRLIVQELEAHVRWD